MKPIKFIKKVVNYIVNHSFTAFIGFCFAVLNIGCVAYLFYDGRTLFGVVSAIVFMLFMIPFGYDCVSYLSGKNTDKNESR
jgi:hypothetical protein